MNGLMTLLLENGTLLAMWGAILLHWLIPIPPEFHPLRLWHQTAIAVATKVNNPKDNAKQRQLSGLLAWSVMWLTVLITLVAMKQFVLFDSLFNLTLLWFAIEWKHPHQLAKRLSKGLAEDRIGYCRHLLSLELNRETDKLSRVGLGKASAETLLLAYGRQVVCVLFWYCLAGGIGAILYRLAMSMARCWSPSRLAFQDFGLPAVRILATVEIIPLRLFALLLAFGRNLTGTIKTLWDQGERWLLPGPGWLLAAAGGKLTLSLGGPAIYAEQRRERPTVGGPIAPAALHIAQLQQLLYWRLWCWLGLCSAWLLVF
nr:cobalamin biosynthesis family protein [Thaumasiovibrio subtropicus]